MDVDYENLFDSILAPTKGGEEDSFIMNPTLPSIGLPQFLEYFNLYNSYFDEKERVELANLFSKYKIYDGQLSEKDFAVENFYLKTIFFNIPPDVIINKKNLNPVVSKFKYTDGFKEFTNMLDILLTSRKILTTIDSFDYKHLRGRPKKICTEIQNFFQRFEKSLENIAQNQMESNGESDSTLIIDLSHIEVVPFNN